MVLNVTEISKGSNLLAQRSGLWRLYYKRYYTASAASERGFAVSRLLPAAWPGVWCDNAGWVGFAAAAGVASV